MTTPPVGVERRVGQRFPYLLPLSLRQPAHPVEGVGFTQDLSSRGVFFFTNAPLDEGAEIEITLRDALRDHPGREHARALPRPHSAGRARPLSFAPGSARNPLHLRPRSESPCASKATNTCPSRQNLRPPSRGSRPSTPSTTRPPVAEPSSARSACRRCARSDKALPILHDSTFRSPDSWLTIRHEVNCLQISTQRPLQLSLLKCSLVFRQP